MGSRRSAAMTSGISTLFHLQLRLTERGWVCCRPDTQMRGNSMRRLEPMRPTYGDIREPPHSYSATLKLGGPAAARNEFVQHTTVPPERRFAVCDLRDGATEGPNFWRCVPDAWCLASRCISSAA
jgi:hypothetical protein